MIRANMKTVSGIDPSSLLVNYVLGMPSSPRNTIAIPSGNNDVILVYEGMVGTEGGYAYGTWVYSRSDGTLTPVGTLEGVSASVSGNDFVLNVSNRTVTCMATITW